MPATTLKLHKVHVFYLSSGAEVPSSSRERTADNIRLAKEAGYHQRGTREDWEGTWYDVFTVWQMVVDNGRGDEWYQAKWESMVCGRPGFEGV